MEYPKVKGLPTEPGWYWVRVRYEGFRYKHFDIVKVYHDYGLRDGFTGLLVKDKGSAFHDNECWGPIPLPELKPEGSAEDTR